jgi:hypothetical protein
MRGDEMDDRIDAALRSYAEPPETPEARVALARMLERGRAETRRSAWFRGWGVAAAGFAAALLVAAVLWVTRAPSAPEIAWTPPAPGVVSIATEPEPAPHSTTRTLVALHREPAAETLPKLETFPSRGPLSDEEQSLVAFAAEVPPAVKKQVIEEQKHLGDPLEIAELKIRPLDEAAQKDPSKGEDKP